MPSIVRVAEIQIEPAWPDRVEFRSPDGHAVLVFENPYEWRMGCFGWDARLIDESHPAATLPGLRGGRRLLNSYAPWARDSAHLLLCGWEPGEHHIVDHTLGAASRPLLKLPLPPLIDYAWSARWSPAADEIICATVDHWIMSDPFAGTHRDGLWASQPNEVVPFASWWESGEFFEIGSTADSCAVFTHEPQTGRVLWTLPLRPAELVPYAAEEYAGIERTRNVLRTGHGSMRGQLLDQWFNFEHAPRSRELRASVYRPVGSCSVRGGSLTCDVVEKRVRITLDW